MPCLLLTFVAFVARGDLPSGVFFFANPDPCLKRRVKLPPFQSFSPSRAVPPEPRPNVVPSPGEFVRMSDVCCDAGAGGSSERSDETECPPRAADAGSG